MSRSPPRQEKGITERDDFDTAATPVISNESIKSTINGLHLLDDPANFPSGFHIKAVMTVIGSFLGLTGALGFVNAAGVIQSYVTENTLKDEAQTAISWIFSQSIRIRKGE